MEDEGVREDASEFQAVKRRKNSLGFTRLGGSPHETKESGRRCLQVLPKRSRSEINKVDVEPRMRSVENVKVFEEDLKFCPACQVPFAGLVGQSPQGHVQECLENGTEASVPCPDGIKCNSSSPQHFKRFSHQQLAKLRSINNSKSSTNQEKNQKQNSCSREINVKAIDKFLPDGRNCCFVNKGCLAFLNNKESCCNKKSSCNTSGTCFMREHSIMEDDTDSITETAIELPKEEIIIVNKSDDCPDEINQWLNDDLKIDDLELDNGSCMSVMNGSDTYSSSGTSTSSLNIRTSAISHLKTAVTGQKQSRSGLVTGDREQTTSLKQMDIRVCFGLRPKQEVNKVRKEIPSGEMSMRNRLPDQHRQTDGQTKHKKCPFYKIVDGTSFAVDAFSFGNVPGVSVYFLSHFHFDHYHGLKKTFAHPIYCSQITANLISLKIKVASQFIHPLPLHSPVSIKNIEVTLLDANHCPGAVMFLFKLPNGKTHLHTGDFRASPSMEVNPFLSSSSIHTLYLDTTYCDSDYSFPPQADTVDYCASLAEDTVAKNPKTLIVVGTYTIGKEKIFIAMADTLQCKVGVRRDKNNVLQCLESEHVKDIITQNYNEAQVHVLPMADLTHQKLSLHLKNFSSHYDKVLAIKPTGWTFTGCEHDLRNIKPSQRGPVTIYGVPYSEHSSFNELEQFVRFIKPYKIIPTVNNNSAKKRSEMNQLFRLWLKK